MVEVSVLACDAVLVGIWFQCLQGNVVALSSKVKMSKKKNTATLSQNIGTKYSVMQNFIPERLITSVKHRFVLMIMVVVFAVKMCVIGEWL